MVGNSCGQLPSGMTGIGPVAGPPAFISVPSLGPGLGEGGGVFGAGGVVFGGVAGVLVLVAVGGEYCDLAGLS